MKFRFRYQQLLDYRKTLEDIAYSEFSEAAQATRAAEAELAGMYESVTAAHHAISATKISGGAQSGELQRLDQFVAGQEIRIEEKRQQIRQLKMREEELQEILRYRAMERKILDKLRETQREEWQEQMKKREVKFLDELATMSHSRRRQL